MDIRLLAMRNHYIFVRSHRLSYCTCTNCSVCCARYCLVHTCSWTALIRDSLRSPSNHSPSTFSISFLRFLFLSSSPYYPLPLSSAPFPPRSPLPLSLSPSPAAGPEVPVGVDAARSGEVRGRQCWAVRVRPQQTARHAALPKVHRSCEGALFTGAATAPKIM